MGLRIRPGVIALVLSAALLLAGLLTDGWARQTSPGLCAPWSRLALRVETPPGAQIFVDGRPTSSPVRACRGARHHLRVSAEGHRSWEWTGVPSTDLTLVARPRPM